MGPYELYDNSSSSLMYMYLCISFSTTVNTLQSKVKNLKMTNDDLSTQVCLVSCTVMDVLFDCFCFCFFIILRCKCSNKF